MKKQNNNTHLQINEIVQFLKNIDRNIDEWVNYFIDQIEEVYHH